MEDCGDKFWQPYCEQLANPVWPTAFYEVIMSLIIFSILWTIRKHIRISGILFFIYLIFNGIERFLIEKIRINTEYSFFGGVTQAEIISLFLIMTGIIGATYLYKLSKLR